MSENKQIKEYVYFNDQEVTSILAQLKNGFPKLIKRMEEHTESENTADNNSESIGDDFKLSTGILSNDFKYLNGASTTTTNGNIDSHQRAIESAYQDYALDIIETDLGKVKSISSNPIDGEFTKFQSNFHLIDFEPLKAWLSISNDNLKKSMLKDITEFEGLYQNINLVSKVFNDTSIVKTNNSFVFADNNNIRMNHTQMQMLSLTNRKITIFGKVEAVINEKHLNDNYNESSMLAVGEMSSKILLSVLKAGFELKKGNRLIKPIAIYFI